MPHRQIIEDPSPSDFPGKHLEEGFPARLQAQDSVSWEYDRLGNIVCQDMEVPASFIGSHTRCSECLRMIMVGESSFIIEDPESLLVEPVAQFMLVQRVGEGTGHRLAAIQVDRRRAGGDIQPGIDAFRIAVHTLQPGEFVAARDNPWVVARPTGIR